MAGSRRSWCTKARDGENPGILMDFNTEYCAFAGLGRGTKRHDYERKIGLGNENHINMGKRTDKLLTLDVVPLGMSPIISTALLFRTNWPGDICKRLLESRQLGGHYENPQPRRSISHSTEPREEQTRILNRLSCYCVR
jgi:hypothetical protein